MIRLNLLKKVYREDLRIKQWLKAGLFTALLIQAIFLGFTTFRATKERQQFDEAGIKLAEVKQLVTELTPEENMTELAGKVAARNNWFTDRRNSPLSILAGLQKNCPNSVMFRFFKSDMYGGKIVLSAPDLNSVSVWLNSHFGNRGNISVTGRKDNKLIIQFVWS